MSVLNSKSQETDVRIHIHAKRICMKLNKKNKKEKVLSLKPDRSYSSDRVDRALIQWMLSFTPTQRLQILQHNIRSIMRLRSGKADT